VNAATTDGDGWIHCGRGHRHWGRFGAAGLLVYAIDDDDHARVLLQHRSDFSHHGLTWGVPGGARASHEDAVTAACREAVEEAGLDVRRLRVRQVHVDDHGGWNYQTVVAEAASPLATTPNPESIELRWQRVDEVDDLELHPGFRDSWQHVRARPVHVFVDAGIGASGDVATLRGQVTTLPGEELIVVESAQAVPDADFGAVVEHARHSPALILVVLEGGTPVQFGAGVLYVDPSWLRDRIGG
jgi:8-oxo-dGTP pyrophosphatase MutT (NUDIX family)